MGQKRTHDSTAPLSVKAVCALVAVAAVIAYLVSKKPVYAPRVRVDLTPR